LVKLFSGHVAALQKISSKSVHHFLSNLPDRQTEKTNTGKNITPSFGGDNKITFTSLSNTRLAYFGNYMILFIYLELSNLGPEV